MTKTSSFLIFLVKTCFISIVKTEKKNSFSLVKLSVYIAFSFGLLVANSIMYIAIKDEWYDNNQLPSKKDLALCKWARDY